MMPRQALRLPGHLLWSRSIHTSFRRLRHDPASSRRQAMTPRHLVDKPSGLAVRDPGVPEKSQIFWGGLRGHRCRKALGGPYGAGVFLRSGAWFSSCKACSFAGGKLFVIPAEMATDQTPWRLAISGKGPPAGPVCRIHYSGFAGGGRWEGPVLQKRIDATWNASSSHAGSTGCRGYFLAVK